MTKFSDWLASQRKAHDRGEISSETYASRLEGKAKEVQEPKDSAFLRSRARFIRNDADNKKRQADIDAAAQNNKRSGGGLW